MQWLSLLVFYTTNLFILILDYHLWKLSFAKTANECLLQRSLLHPLIIWLRCVIVNTHTQVVHWAFCSVQQQPWLHTIFLFLFAQEVAQLKKDLETAQRLVKQADVSTTSWLFVCCEGKWAPFLRTYIPRSHSFYYLNVALNVDCNESKGLATEARGRDDCATEAAAHRVHRQPQC